MSMTPQNLEVLVRPCNKGMCPALYTDEQGRIFVQGSKLRDRTQVSVAGDEEIVEITPELIDFLRSYKA